MGIMQSTFVVESVDADRVRLIPDGLSAAPDFPIENIVVDTKSALHAGALFGRIGERFDIRISAL